ITILNQTQQEVRFTNHPNIYLEVATVKLASEKPTEAQVNLSNNVELTSSAVDSKAIQALQAEVATLQKTVKQLQENGGAVSTNSKGQSQTAKAESRKSKSSYRIPKERVYQILQEATRDDLRK